MVLNNYIELLTSPAKFFRKMDRVKTYFDPWLFFVIIALFEAIIQLPIALLSLVGSGGEDAIISAFSIVLGFALIPVAPFIAAVFPHIGLMILGHTGFYKTYKPMTYALTISLPYTFAQMLVSGLAIAVGLPFMDEELSALDFATIIALIPVVFLAIASTVHTVYTACVGAAHTHRISKLRAFCGMYLIPLALMLCLVIIPLALFMMFLFGAAILSVPLS